jgi:hypothetical protein
LDFRYGGAKKRFAVFDVARRWNRLHHTDEATSFRLSAVDAWFLTDNRPETTSDGRHYTLERAGNDKRPLIGEADGISYLSMLLTL